MPLRHFGLRHFKKLTHFASVTIAGIVEIIVKKIEGGGSPRGKIQPLIIDEPQRYEITFIIKIAGKKIKKTYEFYLFDAFINFIIRLKTFSISATFKGLSEVLTKPIVKLNSAEAIDSRIEVKPKDLTFNIKVKR